MFRFLIALIALTGASAFSVGPASCPALIRHSIATNSLDVQMGRGDKRTAKGARRSLPLARGKNSPPIHLAK